MKGFTAITLCGAAVLGLSGLAQAEGARQLFNCAVVSNCDTQGNCTPTTGQFNFQLSPVDVNADGSGSFSMSIGDAQTTAQFSADYILRWSGDGAAQNQLIFTSDSTAIWVAHGGGDGPGPDIRFLICLGQL